MSEMQLIADRVIVIGRGRLISDTTTSDLLRGLGAQTVRVRGPQTDQFERALAPLAETTRTAPDALEVTGLTAAEIGDLAHTHGLRIHHLAEVEQSLESAYLRLTEDQVDYHGQQAEPVGSGVAR